jgi:hypothetical protein
MFTEAWHAYRKDGCCDGCGDGQAVREKGAQ